MSRYIANMVTVSRILGSVLLLFFPVFSVGFYILYIICGFSDMIDGTIARKTKLSIPKWLVIWAGVIAVIRIVNILSGYASQKRFISLHTIMNKITGLLLFLLPLTLHFVELKYSSIVVCSVATFAAIQEGIYIVRNCTKDSVM